MTTDRNYFAYDHMDGIDFYATEAEAIARAEAVLEDDRDNLDDSGWDENVTLICYGQVLGHVVQTKCEPAPEGSPYDEIWDFAVKSVAPDPLAAASQAVVEAAMAWATRHGYDPVQTREKDALIAACAALAALRKEQP